MERQVTLAYAQLNARIMPVTRGEWFEDPLEEALAASGYGDVGGGGTMQLETGEIEYCGIDVDLIDVEKGVSFVCELLTERGAPKGSKLSYEYEGQRVEVPFGTAEGIAIYLNGTDLPSEVYAQADVNVVFETIDQLLRGRGAIRGYWEGPTETALYLYGDSASEMLEIISDFMAQYSLCQRARIETIA